MSQSAHTYHDIWTFPVMRCLLIASLTVLLGACASAPQKQTVAPDAATPVAEKAIEAPERPIPADALYPLLVAEFALRREQYDLALEHYMTQAEILRDTELSKYVTHIAGSLDREPEALAAASLWAELDPDDAGANVIAAKLLARSGRTQESLDHLITALELGETVEFPMVLNQFEYLPPASQDQLQQRLEALRELHPDNVSLLLTLALLYDERQLPKQSLATLEHLFKLDPYLPEAAFLEAKLLLEADQRDPFRRIEQILEADPENSALRLEYARLLSRGDMAAAKKQFEILAEQSPRNGDLLFSLALINRETGDKSAAKAYLDQVIALGQRTDDAYFYLGVMAEEDGLVREAAQNYLSITDPRSRNFFNARARASRLMIESGQPDTSRAMFAELRAQLPDASTRLYVLEAEILDTEGQSNAALELLDAAIAADDSDALRYSRSLLGERRGDLALMESDLRTIIRRDPENATALNALGYSLSNHTTRYDEALELIEQALELEPNNAAILDSMGWVLYRMGRSEEALPYLEQAYRRFPDPEVAAHLGEVLWANGRRDEARQVWAEAMRGSADHETLKATIQRFDTELLTGN